MPGSYDLGEDGFGDELPGPAASVPAETPAALFFNPQTRVHEISEDGKYVFIHWVDAAVIQSLHISKSKFLAVPDAGVDFWRLPSPHDPRAQSKIEDWTKQALASLIANGDIDLVSVTLETQGFYIMKIEVAYINRRLWPRAEKTASITPGSG